MTEIEKLIEKYEVNLKNNQDLLPHIMREITHAYTKGVCDTYSSIIATLTESLPAERQAIEEAYKKGQIDASDRAEFETPLTKPSDYFNKTFKK